MATTTGTRGAVEGYVAAFERLEAGRRSEPAWLRTARARAIDVFAARGFPTTRDEDWRFTSVAPIADGAFQPLDGAAGASPSVGGLAMPAAGGAVAVFVDGQYAPDLSRLEGAAGGLTVGSLSAVLRDAPGSVEPYLGRTASVHGRPFVALNTALFEDGAWVHVRSGVVLEHPVQIVFVSTGTRPGGSTHPRVVVVAEANSQLRLVETYAGEAGAYFTNPVTEIVAGDSAVVDHYRIQREGDEAYHVGHTQVHAGRASSVSTCSVSIGALISRHDAVAVLGGEGADCTLNGFYLARGRQLVDNHTEIDHATPHGTSHEIYKGILEGRARGVFNGRIRVRPDAQKTDAKQTNKTLLLSDEAQINTKPQLEIFANDVKCTHGATVGQLSEDALFYLRARGIGAEDARSILIRAFAMDVLGRIRLEPVRLELDRLLAGRLPGSLAERAFV